MFVGKSEHTVTKDGRISLPSKMREVISSKYDSDELYIILIPGNIIGVYPAQEFEKLVDKLDSSQGTSLADLTQNEMEMCSNAENGKIDGSGRIVIPQEMKNAAKIDQLALVVGAKTHIELWNPDMWDWNQDRRATDALRKLPNTRRNE
jgi:MraZ protein